MVNKEEIFSLITNRQDKEAKKRIVAYIKTDNEKENQEREQEIAAYLNHKLASLKNIEEIETVEIFAHYANLDVVSKENGSSVDDFHLEMTDVDDTGTYK